MEAGYPRIELWTPPEAHPRVQHTVRPPRTFQLSSPGLWYLGFSIDGELELTADPPRGTFCEVQYDNGWWVSQRSGDRHPLHVNETLCWRRRKLLHLDHLRLSDAWLRYFEGPEPALRSAEHEARVYERPDDGRLWQIYADWLVERGDPRGGRVVQGTPHSNDEAARWLDTLAVDTWSTRLWASWAHGFVHSLTVFAPANTGLPTGAMERALSHPVSRHLRELHIASSALNFQGDLIHQTLKLLSEREWPRSFERLVFRCAAEGPLTPELAPLLEALRQRAPRLRTTMDTLVAALPRR
ncbi:MAG: hypothetical protein K1X89_25545 [Myxococcaceae bacterium]|nr:hypothetical protein [Myxococcaceae bacterium]